MQILLAGTPAMVIPLFDTIAHSDIEIAGVITNPPKARGRSGTPTPSPVSQWASERHLKLFESGHLDECAQVFQEVDLVFVVAFGTLIPERLLKIPRRGWVNLHFSALPEARGAAPVQRLIAAGRQEIASTLFRLDKGMDTGPVFFFNNPVSVAGLTTGEAWNTLVAQASESIVAQLKKIGAGQEPIAQSDKEAGIGIAPKISTEEARIFWDNSPEIMIHKILAFNPTPSAWTTFNGKRFIIHRAAPVNPAFNLPNASQSAIGTLRMTKDRVYLSTIDGEIELIEVQPAGKRRMSAIDWVRGSRCQDGDRFE